MPVRPVPAARPRSCAGGDGEPRARAIPASQAERELWREGRVGGAWRKLAEAVWLPLGRPGAAQLRAGPGERSGAGRAAAGTRLPGGPERAGLGSAASVSSGTNRKLKCSMRSKLSEYGDS